MNEPYEVREEEMTAAEGRTAPVAGAPAGGRRVYAGRTAVVPAAFRARQLVWLIVGVVDAILALRFIFLAAGANDTGFASFVYTAGSALAAPFRGIFGSGAAGTQGRPLEWADIIAIVVYTAAAWIVSRLMLITMTRSTTGVPAPY